MSTALLLSSSCGSAGDSFSSDGSASTVSATTPEAAGTSSIPVSDSTTTSVDETSGSDAPDSVPATLYSTSAGVIETPEHGPEIAFQLLESYPPQGGGLPISNWSWQEAPDFESASGTTWGGTYRLVGTSDGGTFTLTEPVTSSTEPPFEQVYGTPTPGCDEDDFFPVLDFLETLDREALGVIGGAEDAWDGRCGATVEAYFDTTELRKLWNQWLTESLRSSTSLLWSDGVHTRARFPV